VNTSQVQQVRYQPRFNLQINWRVTVQTWREVHLQKPRLMRLIDQNIEPKQLKSVVSVRNEHLEPCCHSALHANDRFDNDVLNLVPDFEVIYVVFSQEFSKSLH
jgi:hypothetical protein